MAEHGRIGCSTIVTGNIVAEEDFEIDGGVEGTVRVANHRLTIGTTGHVKASVEAQAVHVQGRITGDVIASDLVEVTKGGIVDGVIKAPRVVLHDGGIVVGGLDMSLALPKRGQDEASADLPPRSRHLKSVSSNGEAEPDDEMES